MEKDLGHLKNGENSLGRVARANGSVVWEEFGKVSSNYFTQVIKFLWANVKNFNFILDEAKSQESWDLMCFWDAHSGCREWCDWGGQNAVAAEKTDSGLEKCFWWELMSWM